MKIYFANEKCPWGYMKVGMVLCARLKTYDPTELRFPNKVQYGPMG